MSITNEWSQPVSSRVGTSPTVLLVAPVAPPYGGMQLQATLLANLLGQEGVRVVHIPSNPRFSKRLAFMERVRGVRPFARALVFCHHLWRALPEVDVVHVMAASWLYFFLVVYPALYLARLRRVRVVLNYRGGEADLFLHRLGLIANPAFRMANLVTAPSDFLKTVLERRTGVPVEVIPNIVSLAEFRFRDRSRFRPVMLVTRHLEKMYDVATVIGAFSRVQKRWVEATLWVAGVGGEESALRSLVSKRGISGVRFLGHVPHEDLAAVYDQCDICLNASRVDNFPGALLEASACGLVVISTGAGGIPYIYRNEHSALLVNPGDEVALADAVERILRDPSLGHRLAKGGAELVRGFEWARIRSGLFRTYAFG